MHCSLTESGGARNYSRATIRRTEIHSEVAKQSSSFSFSREPLARDEEREAEGRNEGGHT